MKITRNKNNLVVTIPLRQEVRDVWTDEYIGETDNIRGVIVKSGDDDSGMFEQGFYQSIDMSYKGKGPQLGSPLIMTEMDDDEFRALCKKLKIEVEEYFKCAVCKKTLWGTYTYSDNGPICSFGHDN